ncbi:MAG: TIGR02300 family protein [Bdellovibrionales bacterium]
MAKPEWGTKRACPACHALFYDMKKRPVMCPKCGHELDLEAKKKHSRPVKETKKPVAPEVSSEDDEPFDDDESDLLIENTDELEDDDDALMQDAMEISELDRED